MNESIHVTCLNCGHEFQTAFCPDCGQSASTRKITLKGMLEHLTFETIQANRGFLHTFIGLTKSAGGTIAGYLAGKRMSIQNPIGYALIGVTIMTIIDIKTGISSGAPRSSETESFAYNLAKFVRQNAKNFWLLNILYYSIGGALFFRRYSFAEHLAANSFIIGHSAFLMSLVILVYKQPFIVNPVMYFIIITMMVLLHRRDHHLGSAIFLSFLNILFGFLMFFFVPAMFMMVVRSVRG